MKLLVDIGNTRLKWTVEKAGLLQPLESLDYRRSDFIQTLTRSWQALPAPAIAGIASVSNQSTAAAVTELFNTLWPEVALCAPKSTKHAFGVSSAYESPETLGIDRWLALIAAHRYYPGDACVVDCGTAITVDVLQSGGRHSGGLICPGLLMMKKALAADTADLPFDDRGYQTGLANATGAAIANGVLFAAVGAIVKVLQGLEGDYRLILTGGDAEVVAQVLHRSAVIDPMLVLKGLSIYCSGDRAA